MRILALLAIGAGVLLAGSAMNPLAAQSRPTTPPPITGDLVSKPYLYDVVRHLYRWYLDERDLDALVNIHEIEFSVRRLQPKLDPNDHSQFGEITLPQLGVRVRVKQSDYSIDELNTVVKSSTFKIVGVAKDASGGEPPPDCTIVKLNYAEMREALFRTRRDAAFAEGELLERLRKATREELLKSTAEDARELPTGPQIVHIAPLSPVANETWVFWESGRMLLHFASDIDLTNPAVWDQERLTVRTYEVDKQVVVSLDEAAGSNAYLTRDQVGRALFNCIVLGRRMELQPPKDAATSRPGQPR